MVVSIVKLAVRQIERAVELYMISLSKKYTITKYLIFPLIRYDYIRSAFNKFPDFFVSAFKIFVDS